MPGDSGVTCMLVCAFYHFLHTRPRAHRPPGIPCALCLEGGKINEYLAKKAFGEIAKSFLNVIARSTFVRRSPPSGEGGCDEAIHLSACRTMDCFAELAMTVLGTIAKSCTVISPPSTRPCAWRGGGGGGGRLRGTAASVYAAPTPPPPPPPPPPPARGAR